MSTEMTAVQQVCTTLSTVEFQRKIAVALPPGVSPKRFVRTAMTAIQLQPSIASADRNSLYLAVQRAAADNLLPDGREAALVTFGGKVQYMPMVGGIIKKLGESGIAISAEVVRQADTFAQTLGDGAAISHVVPPLGTPRGELIGVYAIARDRNTGEILGREVMDRDQIDQVRKASRSGSAGPWKDWYDEMARKTVIRRLAKRLPLNPQAWDVVTADDDMYSFGDAPTSASETGLVRDITPQGKRRPAALAKVAPTQPEPPNVSASTVGMLDDFHASLDAAKPPADDGGDF